MPASVAKRRPLGINLIGQVSSSTGLGVAGRAMADLVIAQGIPLAVHDLTAGIGRDRAEMQHASHFVKDLAALPYSINLIVLGDNALHSLLLDNPGFFFDNGYFNAAMGFWELSTLPPRWTPALATLDAFVAATDFIRQAHECVLSGPTVITGRLPLSLPQDLDGRRERFGLPEDKTIFITGFEPHSDVERKNASAVVQAFKGIADKSPSAYLVVKVNNAQLANGQPHPVLKRLQGLCDDHPRIRLITDPMTYRDVLSLYQACDVYVSLHRAEGLGLGIVEAMTLGKAVIATGWSGNMTYMNHLNSVPVRYTLVPISGEATFYRASELEEGAVWADADVVEAAAWMQTLATDSVLRNAIGAAARESMASHLSDASAGKMIDELLALRERHSGTRRSAAAASNETASRLLRTSRLAQIQKLERELKWIKNQPYYRAAQRLKRLLAPFRRNA